MPRVPGMECACCCLLLPPSLLQQQLDQHQLNFLSPPEALPPSTLRRAQPCTLHGANRVHLCPPPPLPSPRHQQPVMFHRLTTRWSWDSV